MKHGTKSQEISLEQTGALAGFVTGFLVKVLSPEQVVYWIGHKVELKQKLCEVFRVVDEYVELREEWQKFWKDQLGWSVDFSRVIIPPKPKTGSWRLLVLPKNLTNNKLFARMEQLFTCWKYADDLDAAVPINARTTASHYAVWVRDGVEPDEEFLSRSTREADPDMKIGITLLERMTFSLKYFVETANHLDIKGGTWCSGSRGSGGDVPCVGWNPNDGAVRVFRYDVDYSYSGWGIRRAVSA